VADVFIIEYSSLDITKIRSDIVKNMIRNPRTQPIIDPKSIYKDAKAEGAVDTIVKYDLIGELASQAEALYLRHLKAEDEKEYE
jgi:hypothetical protein